MTRSANAIISGILPLSAPYSRYFSVAAALLFLVVMVASGGHASAAANETEARTLFTKFVAAQNAHNAGDVKAMLWNSPSFRAASKPEDAMRSPIVSGNITKAPGISNPTCHNFAYPRSQATSCKFLSPSFSRAAFQANHPKTTHF